MSWLQKEYPKPARRTDKPKNTVLVNDDNRSRREIVNDFNDSIRWLLKRFYIATGKELRVETLKNLLYHAIHEDVEFVIQNVGPELQKYKELIRGNSIEAFCNMDVKAQYGKLKKYDDSLIMMIKDKLPALEDSEKEEVFEHVNGLLDSYMEFVIFEMIDPILMWKVVDNMDTPRNPEDFGFRFMPTKEYKAEYKERSKEKKKKS